ncbi:MAG: ABC transporter permease [Dehalococcoidia bacterium]|nr:ABC transporter permease [Dehalococcoidia bacterium]
MKTGAARLEAGAYRGPGLAGRLSAWGRAGVGQVALAGVLVLVAVIFAITAPGFGDPGNMGNLSRQASVLGILALGQLFVILVGGLDISIGSTIAAVSIITALASKQVGVAPAFLLGIGFGGVVGLINGFVSARFRIHSLIVTIGTLTMVRGFGLALTGGTAVADVPKDYGSLGGSWLGPVPLPALVLLLVLAVSYFMLRWTRPGRHIYAVGGSEMAALVSGISVLRVRILAFVICGLLTGLAAVVLASRIGSGEPNLGAGMELDAITAVFAGGVMWGGGKGTVWNVLLGVALLSILSNGLNLLGARSYVQMTVVGAVLVLAIVSQRLGQGRR